MPALLNLPRKARARDAAETARLIADLHAILVNPRTARDAAADARAALLGTLVQAEKTRLPGMIVPPIAEAAEAIPADRRLRSVTDRSPCRSARASSVSDAAPLAEWPRLSMGTSARGRDADGASPLEHSRAFHL